MKNEFDISIENRLRKSHCDHAKKNDPQHRCTGTCTITPNGIKLECPQCGNADDTTISVAGSQLIRDTASIFTAAGIDFNALSPHAQGWAIDAMREVCHRRIDLELT